MEDNVLTQVGLPLALALIMFVMGLGLRLDDFARVARQPKDFAVGLGLQMVSLPVIAWGLTFIMPLAPALAVGMILIAACPGGTTSNLLTHMARGDVALAITLTAVTSLLCVVTLPLLVGFALDHFMGQAAPELPILNTIAGVFMITTVPVILGMAVARFAPGFAGWVEPRSRPFVTVLFALIVLGAIMAEREHVLDYFARAGLAALALNVLTMAVAMVAARLTGLGPRQAVAVTLECGLQNGTLAIVIATTMLGSTEIAIPAAIYSLIMFATGSVYVWSASRRLTAAA